MLKSLLTKGLMVALFAALSFQSSFAQVFFSEDFSDQASSTANWVSGGTNTGANGLVWEWTNDPDAGAWNGPWDGPTASTGYFWFDSDGNGAGLHDVTLTNVGAPINCTGKSGVKLEFSTFFRTFDATDNPSIGVSTDGVNFNYISVPQFDALVAEASYNGVISVDISQYADNQPTVWIQFRWEGDFQYYWKVDDITLSEANYNVKFRVNASLLTVDPAGMKIAGSFTNWADADMTNEGNGVWSYTATLPGGQEVLYKFKNGPSGWESGNAACGVSDGFGGYNRNYTPEANATLAAVCFNSCTACVVPCESNPDAIICDKLDSYSTAQKLGPQATWWTTWSGTEGTTEDGIVSTEQAASAPNSLKLVSTAAAGGPQDVVLNLGNKTTGRYELNWKMYVPAGKDGYYNIQNIVPIASGDWNLNVFYNPAGAGQVTDGTNAVLADFSYPYDQWFNVKHVFDLDNNLISVYMNDVFVIKTVFSKNLGGIDFYCTNGTSQFYVDNVEYVGLAPIVYNEDVCESAIDITPNMLGAAGVAVNIGPFDITDATTDPTNDPTDGFGCHFNADALQGNHWFTFTGNGGKFTITSRSCGGAPITGNDTQFALYSGSCGDYTPVDCNDDLSNSDLSSSLTFETVAGTEYFLMVDSYDGLDGTYCLEILPFASVDCASASIGENELANEGFVCWNGNLSEIMIVDPATYAVPNSGAVSGHLWAISTVALDPNEWPGTIPGIASTTASPSVVLVNLPNDGSVTIFVPGTTYYLTSVLVADAELIDPANPANIFNIDPTNGCFFVGESHPMMLVPALEPIVAFSISSANANGNADVELVVEGGIAAVLGDPGLYQFEWSNGATSAGLTDVPLVSTYTVTISDPTGCTDPFVLTVVGTQDPASVKSLSLTPNPTTGLLNLNLSLEKTAEVQVEVFNALGQMVESFQAGNTASVSRSIDLSNAATGMYTIRVRMDNEIAVRRIAVQR